MEGLGDGAAGEEGGEVGEVEEDAFEEFVGL